jgi:hypothetical protein
MNHAGFRGVGRLRQKHQGRAEVSLAAFTFQDVLEFFAEHFPVLDRYRTAGFRTHRAHNCQETSRRKKGNRENHCSRNLRTTARWSEPPSPNLLFVRTESFACVVDFLTDVSNIRASRTSSDVSIEDNSRVKVDAHGDGAIDLL